MSNAAKSFDILATKSKTTLSVLYFEFNIIIFLICIQLKILDFSAKKFSFHVIYLCFLFEENLFLTKI